MGARPKMGQSPARSGRATRAVRTVLAAGVAAVVSSGTVLVAPPALAVDDEPVFPAEAQVRDAESTVRSTAESVGQIQARLAMAEQELDSVRIVAAQRAEAYNGARYRLQRARSVARDAARRAEGSARAVRTQRARLERFAVNGVAESTDLASLGTALTTGRPDDLLAQYGAWSSTTNALQVDLDAFDAAKALATVLRDDADAALDRQAAAAADASEARRAAARVVEVAQTQERALNGETDALVADLARAQGVSTALAQRRQDGLARQAAERAAAEQAAREAAAAEAVRKAAAEQAAADEAVAQAAAEEEAARQAAADATAARTESVQRRRSAAQSQEPSRPDPTPELEPAPESEPEPEPAAEPELAAGPEPAPQPERRPQSEPEPAPEPEQAPEPQPEPAPEPAPEPEPAPAPSGGASAAIAFAKAQLGEPYVWGGAGPDSWDCSGLTMAAWATAGRTLPHYSVAQYDATTPVSQGSLQPGDLVFWSSNGSPSSIYHMGMYLGGGQMIHAPRTGSNVEIVSMYSWIAPDLFSRV